MTRASKAGPEHFRTKTATPAGRRVDGMAPRPLRQNFRPASQPPQAFSRLASLISPVSVFSAR